MTHGIKLFQAMAGAENGGAEIFFERLAMGFHDAGVEQCLTVKPHPSRMELLRGYGLDARPCGFRQFPAFIASHQLRRMVASSRADVILTWMNRATALMPADTGLPHVARLGGFYNLKYYRHCDYLVANTKAIADYLIREGMDKGKIHVQGNFVPDGIAAKNAKRESQMPVFTALGRFHRNKGFDILLDAFALLPAGSAKLHIAGSGAEEAALRKRAADRGITGRVEFFPWQEDSSAFTASGDVFICPSRHEPFGNVIAEAFACAMPVITTATDAAHEYARHESNALVVPVDDAPALAAAMQSMLDDPAAATRLAQGGYATYKKHFTREKVVGAWIDFLTRVARGGG